MLHSCSTFTGVAQVEIGTAVLDVNGNLRFRSTDANTRETSAKDSNLVSDKYGNVQRILSKMVIESYLKTFIESGFSASSDQFLRLSSRRMQVPFNYDEFVTSTDTFTAKNTKIYVKNI